jgi:hypothetical protein
MHGPLRSQFFTHSPCIHPTSGTIVCPDCDPFTCVRCGTTKKQSWFAFSDGDWCFPCYDRRKGRLFGEPTTGDLLTEAL